MTAQHPAIRAVAIAELDALAQLWYDGWQDAHAAILPAKLARLRTLESFLARLGAAIADTRVTGPIGAPDGFAMIRDDEVWQLFVGANARGSGVASILIEDALARIRARGKASAWLACAIGNDRAARFYEQSGWHRAGTMTSQLQTPDGIFPLDVWRYEIAL